MDYNSLWTYNCNDCAITMEIYERIQANIDQLNLRQPADFQQVLFNAVLESMIRGVRIDVARRGEYEMMLLDELNKRETWLTKILGHPINPSSPKQMQALFYNDLGQRPIMKRVVVDGQTKQRPTVDDSALIQLGEREPLLLPLIRKIQELRSIRVFLSTFVRMPLDYDQRMRTSFNIAGTETYRFSSSENPFGNGGNLENLPKGGTEDDSDLDLPNIRAMFLPDPGCDFFDIDLSKADLRIVYWEADAKEGKAMLKEGLDPYIELAREYFQDPTITKYRENGTDNPKYKMFKSFAHATHYLGTARGISQRIGLTVHETEKTQKWYFGRVPEVEKYQQRVKNELTKRRYVENVFGYRWYCFDRIDDNAFRQAAAYIPQSSVACLINRGYYNIFKNLREVWVLLQVHDSLAGQFPSHLGDWAKRRIVEECSIPLPYEDPLTIPVGIATSSVSWGDCR